MPRNSHKTAQPIIIATAAAMAMLTTTADAKDWIQKVDIAKDGVDVRPIEVSANISGYTKMKTKSHKFLLRAYANAKKGKRIGHMFLMSAKGSNSSSSWVYTLPFRDIGSGKKRQVKAGYKPKISTSKISWHMSRVTVCNLLKAQKMSSGMSKQAVLSKTWNATATAKFYAVAYAEKPKNAKKQGLNPANNGSFTREAAGMMYKVSVRCLSGYKKTS